jgi:hypothetical protein
MCNCPNDSVHQCAKWPERVPHKHSAVIKAWADGAEIEYRYPPNITWKKTSAHCGWDTGAEYRVKPIPKPLWKVAHDAWYATAGHQLVGAGRWNAVADAVVKAYKEQQ